MPMMRIRVVGMAMRHRLMPVTMAVPRAVWHLWQVRVLVMRVMNVLMLMFEGLMVVFVLVPLSEMQPHTNSHQRRRDKEPHAHRFLKPKDGHERTRERRDGEVGRRSRCAQVAERHDEKNQAHSVCQRAHHHRAGGR